MSSLCRIPAFVEHKRQNEIRRKCADFYLIVKWSKLLKNVQNCVDCFIS